MAPSYQPTVSSAPSYQPTVSPQPSAQPTYSPTPRPTPKPTLFVTGEIVFRDVVDNTGRTTNDVFKAAVADLVGVDTADVVVTYDAYAGRRLAEGVVSARRRLADGYVVSARRRLADGYVVSARRRLADGYVVSARRRLADGYVATYFVRTTEPNKVVDAISDFTLSDVDNAVAAAAADAGVADAFDEIETAEIGVPKVSSSDFEDCDGTCADCLFYYAFDFCETEYPSCFCQAPTSAPTPAPSATPTVSPAPTATQAPTPTPTPAPSAGPTASPAPTAAPTLKPTSAAPTYSARPTKMVPTDSPTDSPTRSQTKNSDSACPGAQVAAAALAAAGLALVL